jgi:hypothetical protein
MALFDSRTVVLVRCDGLRLRVVERRTAITDESFMLEAWDGAHRQARYCGGSVPGGW